MKEIKNIKIYQEFDKNELCQFICKKFHINSNNIKNFIIQKKSIDARKKDDIHYVYNVSFIFKDEKMNNENNLLQTNILSIERLNSVSKSYFFNKLKDKENNYINLKHDNQNIVIVGAGPAGLFAALTLVDNGLKPIILEQGKSVEERKQDVDNFIKTGVLNPSSNIQFGEGGAGTFSDGKLTSNLHNPLCLEVLKNFVKFGAPEEILYLSKPHMGTDKLINIIKNMRNYILQKGGKFLFNSQVIDLKIEDNKIKSVIYKTLNNKDYKTSNNKFYKTLNNKNDDTNITELPCSHLILAIGHSSRNMFYKLYEKGANIKAKNFSVGVRIEHLQEAINEGQYGINYKSKTKLNLPPAEYKLVYHNEYTGRSCYTFCMCPGGTVMASSSEENTIVTNGMSVYKRNGKNANSAILVNVSPSDFGTPSPLAGVEFQKRLEEKAFNATKSFQNIFSYFAPAQKLGDFLNNTLTFDTSAFNLDISSLKGNPSLKSSPNADFQKNSHTDFYKNHISNNSFVNNYFGDNYFNEVKPTYLPGVIPYNLNLILPDFVTDTMKNAFPYFDSKLHGFANPNSVLTGVETRSSSPVTIVRNDNFMSNIDGIYPCGEGAGYAGGIMSASVDGIKCALAVIG